MGNMILSVEGDISFDLRLPVEDGDAELARKAADLSKKARRERKLPAEGAGHRIACYRKKLNDSRTALALLQGEAPVMVDYGKCDALFEMFGSFVETEKFGRNKRFTMIYDARTVYTICGRRYLVGPAIIVCGDPECLIWSITEDELPWIKEYIDGQTRTLTDNDREIKVFEL